MPQSESAAARQLFYLGFGFYVTGRRALENVEIEPGVYLNPGAQAAVNLTLSSELFIKSLIARSGATAWGHELELLYPALPAADQSAMLALYARYNGRNLTDDIRETSKYFVKLRYMNTTRGNVFRSYDPPAAAAIADSLYRHCADVFGEEVKVSEFRI